MTHKTPTLTPDPPPSSATMCNDVSLDNELTRAYKKMLVKRQKDDLGDSDSEEEDSDDGDSEEDDQSKLDHSLSTEQVSRGGGEVGLRGGVLA